MPWFMLSSKFISLETKFIYSIDRHDKMLCSTASVVKMSKGDNSGVQDSNAEWESLTSLGLLKSQCQTVFKTIQV